MAYHGRSARGRGGSSFRGRGRGKGGVRNGRQRSGFASARITEQDDSVHEIGEQSDSADEDDESEVERGSIDEAEEPTISIRPYTLLLQDLSTGIGPKPKRQKIEASQSYDINKTSSTGFEYGQLDVDIAEEPEEGPETAITSADGDDEDEDNEVGSDPFDAHFANPEHELLTNRLKAVKNNLWRTLKIDMGPLGKGFLHIPGDGKLNAIQTPTPLNDPRDLVLKKKLIEGIMQQAPTFNALERILAPMIFNYQDILYCERTTANAHTLRRLACLHAVNHVFKTRDRVIKNNSRLAKEESECDSELRDQGFTRPKVLFLLPTRESCVRVVDAIIALCSPEQQENRKRFDDAYIEKDNTFSADKAEDFRELFSGNDDDMFRLGMKFTRKTIKYFAQFYNSDIIFASPLGLRMAIGADNDKKVDFDFLSSIEVVIVDQANSLLMQNWEHMEFIFEHLNLQPKEAHGCDFGRVREWYLDNNGKYFRQTISFSSFNTPELNTLLFNRSQNWAGRIKITSSYGGTIQDLGLKVKQTFQRFEADSPTSDPDARFSYFTTAIIPSLTRHTKDSRGTLIFIPSYLDFVRVRNYFSTSNIVKDLSFASISEYTSVRDVARARSYFFTARHNILIYTERAHHFRRYQIRGVRKVIMYGLPDNPIFYKEIVGGYLGRSLQEGTLESGDASVRVLFSKWDMLKLERIAGTERVGRMIRDKGDTFDFI